MALFFIAEIGINHNGDLRLAKQMIQLASEAGCDGVKFQKRDPDVCVPDHQKKVLRHTPWGEMTYLDYKKRIEFDRREYDQINLWCQEFAIDWMASAWDTPSFEFLKSYDLKHHKVASAMLTHHELLAEIAKDKKHTFISTGMSTLEEIEQAVDIFRRHQCPFELMHSVSTYPMPNEEANLKTMITLKDHFNCAVGYSGHEVGLQITLAAVALGATSVERHITMDRSLWGSDQAASLGPNGLRRLVRDCRIVEKALGDGRKRVMPSEEQKRLSLRKV